MTPTGEDTILNPDTYLNHLSPAAAQDFEFSRNVFLVVLGATLWDILVYISEDIRIVWHNPFQIINFAFIFSRLFAVGYMFCSVIARTTPTQHPHVVSLAGGCLCSLSVSLSAFLFLRRVCAVYSGNRVVQWIFTSLWILYAGSTITVPLGVIPVIIPGTPYFNGAIVRPIVALSALSALLFDSCVFLAISLKVGASCDPSNEQRFGWANVVSGKALPRLSRAVLQGGQQYYLITVISTIVSCATLFSSSVPSPVKSILAIPVVPLIASMASRVFRNVKLLNVRGETMHTTSDIEFASIRPAILPSVMSTTPTLTPSA